MAKSKGRRLAEWLRNLDSNSKASSDTLADDSVSTAKLQTDSVTNPKIADGAIHTANLADQNVTFAKLHTALVVTESDAISSNDNDTTIATSAAIKDYVDTQVATKDNSDEITEGSTNLYFTNERVDDRVNSLLTAGTGITLTYDDTANTLTVAGAAQYGDSDVSAHLNTSTASSGEYLSWNGSDFDWATIPAGYTDSDVASYLSTNGYGTSSSIIASITDSAPTTLDTLNELAAALGDDANFSTTVTNSIGTKWTQDNTKISNWDTAYSWGNHASAGYLTLSGSQTITGTKTFSSSGGNVFLLNDTNATNSTDANIYFYFQANGSNLGYVGYGTSSNNYLYISNPSAPIYLAGSSVLLRGGYEAWGVDNDGSGSGLDADLWDGNQFSTYLNQDVKTTSNPTFNDIYWNGAVRGYEGSNYIGFDPRWNESGYNTNEGVYHFYATTASAGTWGQTGLALYSGTHYNFLTTKSGDYNFYTNNNKMWHAGNDGSGSGLDADTVDGIQGASFLRSDANDTGTGSITLSGLDQSLIAQYNIAGNNWSGRIISSNTSTGVASFLGNYNGYAGVFAHNSALNAWAPIYINTLSTGGGAANVYLGTTYINGAQAWHAGNDGSGSGLDADTVDGIQGASFLRSDASDTASGKITFTAAQNDLIEVDTSATSPYLRFKTSGSNNGYFQFTTTEAYFWNDRQGRGIRLSSDGNLYYYTGAYQLVWHAGNDGSGSGLDADLWDGNQFSSYLNQAVLTTSGPTFANVYNNGWFRNYGEQGLYSQSYGQHFYPDSGGFYWDCNGVIRIRNGYEGTVQLYLGYHSTEGQGMLSSGGSWWLNTGTLASDGSHLLIGGYTSANAYNTLTGRRIMIGGGDTDARDNYFIGTNMENVGGNYNKLDLRWHTGIRMGAQAQYGGVRIFDSEDVGTTRLSISNSVDHGGAGVRAGPWAGSQSSQDAAFEVRNSGGTGDADLANIAFHCANYYGTSLHLRADSYFGVGGWSASAWRWYVQLTTGNMTAVGNVTAYSDPRLKENITPLTGAIEKIKKLNGMEFTWKDLPDIVGTPGGRDYGVLSTEVAEVAPHAIHESPHTAPEGDTYKTVAYDKLIPLLIEAIKEQQKEIDELKRQN